MNVSKHHPLDRKVRARDGGVWTPAMDEVLQSNYGEWTAKGCASRINKIFGTSFTETAIHRRACFLNLDGPSNQGLLTITEAARQIGLAVNTLWWYIKDNDLPLDGHGKHRYLTPKTWQHIQKKYPPPPVECIDVAEVAKRLNYTPGSITQRWIPAGKITAHRFGQRWMIPVTEVERLEREQRGASVIGDLSPELGKKRR